MEHEKHKGKKDKHKGSSNMMPGGGMTGKNKRTAMMKMCKE